MEEKKEKFTVDDLFKKENKFFWQSDFFKAKHTDQYALSIGSPSKKAAIALNNKMHGLRLPATLKDTKVFISPSKGRGTNGVFHSPPKDLGSGTPTKDEMAISFTSKRGRDAFIREWGIDINRKGITAPQWNPGANAIYFEVDFLNEIKGAKTEYKQQLQTFKSLVDAPYWNDKGIGFKRSKAPKTIRLMRETLKKPIRTNPLKAIKNKAEHALDHPPKWTDRDDEVTDLYTAVKNGNVELANNLLERINTLSKGGPSQHPREEKDSGIELDKINPDHTGGGGGMGYN